MWYRYYRATYLIYRYIYMLKYIEHVRNSVWWWIINHEWWSMMIMTYHCIRGTKKHHFKLHINWRMLQQPFYYKHHSECNFCVFELRKRARKCVCFLPKTQQKWIDQLEQSFPNNTDTQYILSIHFYSYHISKHVFHQVNIFCSSFLRLKLPCLCITPIVQTNLKIRITLFNAHSQRVLCSKLNSKPCLTIDIHRFLQLLCYDKSFKIPLAVQRTATILQTISFKLETSKLFPLSLSNFDFLWALRKRWGIEGPVAEK